MDIAALLAAAAAGDQRAWDTLVERFSGLLWSIGRSYGLSASDAGDACQTTWLRLVENLDRIAEPERLASWLATVVRRECLQIIRRARAVDVGLDESAGDAPATGPAVDNALLVAERDATLWSAVYQLPSHCVRLLRALMAAPPPAYRDVAESLGLPVGSIGPTRQRCLGRLRDILRAEGKLGPDWTEDWP